MKFLSRFFKKEKPIDIEDEIIDEAIRTPIEQPIPSPADIPITTPKSDTPPAGDRVRKWCEAIIEMENMSKYHKDKNNPCAIKSINGGFLTFKDWDTGFNYCCDYLIRAATGKHTGYPKAGETTLLEFQKIYSPAEDKNNPYDYASYVAKRLKVDIDTKIKDLI